MLLVSRKAGQHLIIQTPIGEEIIIRVHRIKGSTITLGIDAKDSYHILREELLSAKEYAELP